MKTKHFLMLFTAVMLISVTSCKKYDDGPTISLMPKAWRVANTWKMEKLIVSGVEQTVSSGDTYEYKTNGDYNYKSSSGLFNLSGTWEFGSKKETIKLTISGITSETKILRLTSSEMWLLNDSGTNEAHFVSAN